MKAIFNIFSIVLVCLLVASCGTGTNTDAVQEDNTSEENSTNQSTTQNFYGEQFDQEGAVDIHLLGAKLEEVDSLDIKLVGTINSTCAMKGCWMKMSISEEEEMRVSFKDYGFFVPKEGMEGKKATLQGYVKKVVTDVETLKHFAKDAGKSAEEIEAITEPKEEVSFVASGVLIEDAE